MIRVGVIGACGRMGLMVCRALADAEDFALVAAIDRSKIGQQIGQMIGHPEIDAPVSDELERLLEANAEVAIDFTHPEVVMDDIRWCISHAVHVVVGTTGISAENLQEIEKLLSDEIDVGRQLRHPVLDLEPRIDLEEPELAVLIEEELCGRGVV